uniref:Uncharacterized protein n=1 Tax=Arundo donax TaxID=35708 RepID=A0A0A9CX59_ARUDO
MTYISRVVEVLLDFYHSPKLSIAVLVVKVN